MDGGGTVSRQQEAIMDLENGELKTKENKRKAKKKKNLREWKEKYVVTKWLNTPQNREEKWSEDGIYNEESIIKLLLLIIIWCSYHSYAMVERRIETEWMIILFIHSFSLFSLSLSSYVVMFVSWFTFPAVYILRIPPFLHQTIAMSPHTLLDPTLLIIITIIISFWGRIWINL